MKRIEEFTDQELIDELRVRYSEMVFAGRKKIDIASTKVTRSRSWNGDLDACQGLCMGILAGIAEDVWGIKENNII